MEGAAVGLSSWEHQILRRIAEELVGSDPKLASLATGFNRLAASEEMPPRPRLRSVRSFGQGTQYRRSRRASWFFMATWFLTTAGMIVIALVLNLVGPATGSIRGCAQPRAASCSGKGMGALPVLLPGARS
jgi:Protein of unknown function (DUF3040)